MVCTKGKKGLEGYRYLVGSYLWWEEERYVYFFCMIYVHDTTVYFLQLKNIQRHTKRKGGGRETQETSSTVEFKKRIFLG